MPSADDLESELDALIERGQMLYYALAKQLGRLDKTADDLLSKSVKKLPNFTNSYDDWYSVAMRVVRQIIPDRFDDFVSQYKQEKRKSIDALTYTISDYLVSITTSRGGEVIADGNSAIPKFFRQLSILRSAKEAFKSHIADLKQVLQAELFDSELHAADTLNKNGFFRAAGAMAGVVLERHLHQVCDVHGHRSLKKHPTISEFNDLLKNNGVIDLPKWRFIQHLGDLRNLCDHPKDRDPTKEDVGELIEGVTKVTKTVN
jgi:hypothetical protein